MYLLQKEWHSDRQTFISHKRELLKVKDLLIIMTGNRQGRKRLYRRGRAGTHGRQDGRGQGEGAHDQAGQGRGRQDQPTGVQNSIQTVIEFQQALSFPTYVNPQPVLEFLNNLWGLGTE
jgi:hypothetical protein